MENSVIIYTTTSLYGHIEFYYAEKQIEPKIVMQTPKIGESTNYLRAYAVPYGTNVKCLVNDSGYIFNIYPLGFTLAPIFSSDSSNVEFIAVRDLVIRLVQASTNEQQNAPT